MKTSKIVEVKISPINIPLDVPFHIAIGSKSAIENVLITITLDNGIIGYGEAAPLEPINGENQQTVIATLKSCKAFLIGQFIHNYIQVAKQIKSVFSVQASARCAIEMALLDAYTQQLGISFHQFSGGIDQKIETDYTIDIIPANEAQKRAVTLTRKGYQTLKTKVGKDLNDDLERVRAIHTGAPAARLMLDANQGFSPNEAIRFIRELEKMDIYPDLFEQPVAKDDYKGMKYVKEHIDIPVAADESVFSAKDALIVSELGCADYINIKLMKSGIIDAFAIATIAQTAGINLMIGCMLESHLGLTASVAFAAGIGNFNFVDLDPHIAPQMEPFTGGNRYQLPCYHIDQATTGLGIKPVI